MEFEDILLQVGGFGRFQRNLTIFFLIPVSVLMPWFWLCDIFMLSVPKHWCYNDELSLSNLTIDQQSLFLSPPINPSCYMYNVSIQGANATIANETDIVACNSGWQYDTKYYDSTAATKWNMVCEHEHFPSLVFSLTNVGSLILSPLYGFISDRFGRKVVFFGLAVMVSATGLASLFVNDIVVFMVLRTINGSGMPTIYSLPNILIMELAAPNVRAHIKGIMEVAFSVGVCILPLVAYYSRNWVNLGLIVAIVGFAFLVYWSFIPESPCWLISRKRYKEALEIMMEVGAKNGKPQDKEQLYSQLQALGAQIEKTKREERAVAQSRFLKYPRLRRNFFIITFCWTAFFVTYDGLLYNMRNLDGNEFINFFLLAFVELPGTLVFWYLMHRLGRRWTGTFCYLMIGITCLTPLIGFHYSDVVSSLVGKFLIAGAGLVTDQQASEMFPTVARSFGIGSGKTIATAATLFVPYIAYLSTYDKSIPFIIIGLACFIGGILTTFLPETVDENLPQTFSDAEELGRDQKFLSWNRLQKA